MKILMIDNYDSFTYNVVYLLKELGLQVAVLQNDCKLEDIKACDFSSLIISPGPSHPEDSGICLEAIKHFAPYKKILGICLGHQCIAHVFGGIVEKLKNPMHGKSAQIIFNKHPLFYNIKAPMQVGLYHSLHVSSPGNCLPLAHTNEGVIMALQAKNYHTYGFQFHPESILQQQGKQLIKNFLAI